ncbi:MAG: exo-alpha-sialidase, partial [Bacteroidia bacterium]|nr:exo-alpha-sialidase [Bacteroidia bacterium]
MKQKLLNIIVLLIVSHVDSIAQTNYNLSNLLSFDGEPYIAVNPANQNNIIAAWMRLRADGKIWIATKASFDKGQSWSAINFMPHDSVINGSADVSIAFHHSGTAYLTWINFRTNPDTAGAVFISKSIDGGLTWGTPNKVIDDKDKPDNPFDRPWVAVDNSGGINDGAVYVTSMTAYWRTGQHHIYLRTSSDGGLTWGMVKQVDTAGFSVGVLTACYGGISIGKDGNAYIAYLSYDVSVSPFVRYFCATTNNLGITFQRNLVGNASISGGSSFTRAWSVAANPAINGNAVLTWVDNRNGDYDILISKTINGGLTWTSPTRVNDDSLSNGIEQDMVWANFSPSGKLAIAWRDRRLNGIGSTVPFDLFAAYAIDSVNTLSSNFRITSVSSPYFAVPQGNSFIGCAISDSSIYFNWGDYRNSPDWDIFFNKSDLANLSSVNEIATSSKSINIFP